VLRDAGVTMVTGGEWRVVGPRLHGSGLLRAVKSDASRAELQADFGLRDRKSFFERYLKPSFALGIQPARCKSQVSVDSAVNIAKLSSFTIPVF
jgi:hypothetical protein